MQKKIPFVLLVLITITFLSLARASSHLVTAISPSPSPSLTPVSDQDVTENLKKRLQSSLTEQSTTPPVVDARAYIGVVKDIIKDTIIIEDKDGKKDLKLQADTTILRSPGNATIKPDNIRIDDSIIAMGYPTSEDILLARRLILSTNPILPPAKKTELATLSKIDKNTLTIKTNDKEQVLKLSSKTITKSALGSIELSDLAVGDKIIYTATLDKDSAQTATIIMRIQTTQAVGNE